MLDSLGYQTPLWILPYLLLKGYWRKDAERVKEVRLVKEFISQNAKLRQENEILQLQIEVVGGCIKIAMWELSPVKESMFMLEKGFREIKNKTNIMYSK